MAGTWISWFWYQNNSSSFDTTRYPFLSENIHLELELVFTENFDRCYHNPVCGNDVRSLLSVEIGVKVIEASHYDLIFLSLYVVLKGNKDNFILICGSASWTTYNTSPVMRLSVAYYRLRSTITWFTENAVAWFGFYRQSQPMSM